MIEDLEGKLGKQTKGKEPLMLTQGLGEDEENYGGHEEEIDSEEEKRKALALSPPLEKKDKIV